MRRPRASVSNTGRPSSSTASGGRRTARSVVVGLRGALRPSAEPGPAGIVHGPRFARREWMCRGPSFAGRIVAGWPWPRRCLKRAIARQRWSLTACAGPRRHSDCTLLSFSAFWTQARGSVSCRGAPVVGDSQCLALKSRRSSQSRRSNWDVGVSAERCEHEPVAAGRIILP